MMEMIDRRDLPQPIEMFNDLPENERIAQLACGDGFALALSNDRQGKQYYNIIFFKTLIAIILLHVLPLSLKFAS